MGMSEGELDQITLRSFFNKLIGFRKVERDGWEQVRAQTFLLLSPNFKEGATILPQDIMPFSWDVEINGNVIERAKEAKETRDKIFAQIDAEKLKK